jgi:hypothetical protein
MFQEMYKGWNSILLLQATACAQAGHKTVVRQHLGPMSNSQREEREETAVTHQFALLSLHRLTEQSHFWNSEHNKPVLSDWKLCNFSSKFMPY